MQDYLKTKGRRTLNATERAKKLKLWIATQLERFVRGTSRIVEIHVIRKCTLKLGAPVNGLELLHPTARLWAAKTLSGRHPRQCLIRKQIPLSPRPCHNQMVLARVTPRRCA